MPARVRLRSRLQHLEPISLHPTFKSVCLLLRQARRTSMIISPPPPISPDPNLIRQLSVQYHPGSADNSPAVSCWQSQALSSPHPSALFRPCLRPSERVPARSAPSKPPPAPLEAVLSGTANGPGRAQTVANRAGTALTGAVRTGLQSPRFTCPAPPSHRPESICGPRKRCRATAQARREKPAVFTASYPKGFDRGCSQRYWHIKLSTADS